MAEVLNIGKNKAYELVKTEGFPVIYIGSSIRIPVKALNRWLNEGAEYLY
ncbi:MAG: helix-turn-helix domain-containing protein [Oscillospiraceae bacterium]|nr:helix-turn-helix domain-containing protein [Oscillospiraceae bacterium]